MNNRCFDNEISDAAFERQSANDRDAEREPVLQPRYPAPAYRRLELQARFADILSAGVIQPPTERK